MIDASNWTLAFSITALVFLLLVLIPSMAIRISNLRVLNVLAFVSFAVVWVIIMVFGGDQISSGEQMNVPIPAFLDNVMKVSFEHSNFHFLLTLIRIFIFLFFIFYKHSFLFYFDN